MKTNAPLKTSIRRTRSRENGEKMGTDEPKKKKKGYPDDEGGRQQGSPCFPKMSCLVSKNNSNTCE